MLEVYTRLCVLLTMTGPDLSLHHSVSSPFPRGVGRWAGRYTVVVRRAEDGTLTLVSSPRVDAGAGGVGRRGVGSRRGGFCQSLSPLLPVRDSGCGVQGGRYVGFRVSRRCLGCHHDPVDSMSVLCRGVSVCPGTESR